MLLDDTGHFPAVRINAAVSTQISLRRGICIEAAVKLCYHEIEGRAAPDERRSGAASAMRQYEGKKPNPQNRSRYDDMK